MVMNVLGIALGLLGATGAILYAWALPEIAMICALAAGGGAWLLWGWIAGASVAVVGLGAVLIVSWRKFHR